LDLPVIYDKRLFYLLSSSTSGFFSPGDSSAFCFWSVNSFAVPLHISSASKITNINRHSFFQLSLFLLRVFLSEAHLDLIYDKRPFPSISLSSFL
jgi:hypothetical protein